MNSVPSEAQQIFDEYAEKMNTDILFYNGPIRFSAKGLQTVSRRFKRENVLLVLVTSGGDPNGGYKLARLLQKHYKKFTQFVTGWCKSAGTLVALGANELVFSDCVELGPLDIQTTKKDDLFSQESGLTVMTALQTLEDRALVTFENFFLKILNQGEGSITIKTAGEIATSLTSGLYSSMYAQIDPLHVGEMGRAMSIADHYGRRLAGNGKNINPELLKFLLTNYPSHGFVIDIEEAKILFNEVRQPDPLEELILFALGDRAISLSGPSHYNDIVYLNSEFLPHQEQPNLHVVSAEGETHEPNRATTGS